MKKLRVFFKTLNDMDTFIKDRRPVIAEKGSLWVTIIVPDDFPGVSYCHQILYKIREVTDEPTQVYADDLTW